MNLFRHNWPWKLVCLIGAIMLTFYVRKQEDRVQRTLLLPISATVPAGQRMLEPAAGATVRVELEGPAELIRVISNDEVKLLFDPSAVQPGKRTEVPVVVEIAEKYRSRVMVDWRPSVVPVRIVSDASRSLSVQIRQLEAPDEWEFKEGPVASPGRVTVSGTQDVVNRIASVVAPIKVPETDRVYEPSVRLEALDERGRSLTDQVQIEPPIATVKGLQQRVVLQKRLLVQPVFTVPPGMRIVSVEVTPKYTRVLGKERLVTPLFVAETEPVAIPATELDHSQEIGLLHADPGLRYTPDQVRVRVRLVPMGAPITTPDTNQGGAKANDD